ncbi:MAG: hypothetical protein GY862_34295 [Gammaproteobacteria bacterium]|nr:hypothetical protein [Gammaproteobacteria bacterium]
MTKTKIFQERTVYTHSELYSSAEALLVEAKETKATYLILYSLIGCAFSLEAYLNHLGEAKISYWDQIERIPTMGKLAIFHKHLDIKPDYSRRPYQTIRELWKFRNYMAHAKTGYESETWEQPIGVPINREYPKMKWEKYCTIANAEQAFEDIKKIITELHTKAKMQKGMLGMLGEAGGRVVQ